MAIILFKQNVPEPDGKGGTHIVNEISHTIKQETGSSGIKVRNIYFEKGFNESHLIVLYFNGVPLPLANLKTPNLVSNNILPQINEPYSFEDGTMKIEAIANVPGIKVEFKFSVEYEYSN